MADKSFNLVGRKLMIAIPCYDGKVNIKTCFAIAQLVPKLDKMGVQIHLVHLSGCSIITKARNKLVANFMESDCTDMLFVDADVVINVEAVTRLLALSTDRDIVAGTYPRRAADAKFFLDFYLDEDNQLEFDENGLMRVESVATGFMLIRRHVMESMIAPPRGKMEKSTTFVEGRRCLSSARTALMPSTVSAGVSPRPRLLVPIMRKAILG